MWQSLGKHKGEEMRPLYENNLLRAGGKRNRLENWAPSTRLGTGGRLWESRILAVMDSRINAMLSLWNSVESYKHFLRKIHTHA